MLMYHSVAGRMTDSFRDFTVTADRLAEHLAALRDGGWQTITMSDAVAQLRRPDYHPCRKLVALTFDDAYADFATHAMPALSAARAKATLFVPTAHVGRRAGWLPGDDATRPLLGWSDLADAGGAGVEIGSHGHEHAPLDLGRPGGIYSDLRRSRLILEDRLGTAITTLAYPYGYQTGKTRHAARDAGFDAACTVVGLPATAGDRQLALPRLAATHDMRGDDLLALLTRRPRPAQRRLRRGKQHLWYAARKTRLIAPAVPLPDKEHRR
jgi:peptidoglycan/xylan/chitin deacetylase (PgdA/CDA1 family)